MDREKYVIEVPDDTRRIWIDVFGDGHCYTIAKEADQLEKLNSDYINEHYGELQDEAYQRGYDDGYEAGCATAFKPVSDAEYQRGLEDAWVAVRKIVSMPDDPYWELFGDYKAEIIKNTTVSEVIAKIKAYDDKHPDRIEVGDEVEWEGEKFTILRVFTPKGCYEQCDGFDDAGNGYTNILTKDVKKTGKHYDIQSILEAMRQ